MFARGRKTALDFLFRPTKHSTAIQRDLYNTHSMKDGLFLVTEDRSWSKRAGVAHPLREGFRGGGGGQIRK